MTLGQSQVNLLTIDKFAKICRTTSRTLRFYEQKGLLKPAQINPLNGYRLYNPLQARDFFRIKLLQNFHISLNQIPKFPKGDDSKKFLEQELRKIEVEIEEKQKEFQFLKQIKSFIFGTKTINKLAQVKSVGPYILFGKYIEHGRYDRINSEIKELYKVAGNLGIRCAQSEMVFYPEPGRYGPGDIKLEVTLITKYKKPISVKKFPKDYYFKSYPKQKVALYNYQGPYAYLTFIHQKFVQQSNYFSKINSEFLPFDIHIKGPLNSSSQYDYLTLVGYPVK